MLRLLIVGRETTALVKLSSRLNEDGYRCSIIPGDNGFVDQIAAQCPNLVVVEADGSPARTGTPDSARMIKQELSLPVIALIDRDNLDNVAVNLNVDDFVISPCDYKELLLRIKRRLKHISRVTESEELIKCDGLVIYLAKCKVTVDGKMVELTYREYELLRFLARNRGRVYTRDALLNKVWGYDYYGGDRTVDVHVRRLRGKIEESHTFIETVRNIGYRFIEDNNTSPSM